jgi:NADPH-dependent 2,4-dienoyl-CoA reductase/sulfur reductase-like enzyme
LLAQAPTGVETITYDRLVIATGARELFLPLPGWTLPGVMGAGAAQALLKSGADFSGARVVVAGSGPLLLAVGASFSAAGADVVGVFEQAPLGALLGFCLHALSTERAIEGAKYFARLGSAPYVSGGWVTAALGADRLEEVALTDGTRMWNEPCDLLACAFGLVPNTELAGLIGCEVGSGPVTVDENQETSVAGVYAAGEPVGIGGLDLALAEGAVAGSAAAGIDDAKARAKVAKLAGFRDVLERQFALRGELLNLGQGDTILCRCEDVRLRDIDPRWSAREAKLTSRFGMGPCQGRICGPAARLLFGWDTDRVRPPLYPTEVNLMAVCKRATTP